MNTTELKEFLIEEFGKEIPSDKIRDGKTLRELVLADMDEPLADILLAEFCEKNPGNMAVINPLEYDPATETAKSAKYKMMINHAALAYLKKEVDSMIKELNDTVQSRPDLENG